MNPQVADPTAFRDAQRQQWDVAADGWRRWHDLLQHATAGVSERLCELAGLQAGSRVLDVAAGYGEPALTAARLVGGEGHVVATDISAAMLAFGRERAQRAGLANVEFVEASAASLEYPSRSFDAALSRWGIIFDPDPETAAARVHEMLEPGGRFAISSWGTPEQVPLLALPMGVAIAQLGIEPPPGGMPGPLARPTPEALGSLLDDGGFDDVHVEHARVELEFDSAEDFTTFVREIAPPVVALIAPHPEDVQERTWAAIADAARGQATESGALRLSNVALLASGRA